MRKCHDLAGQKFGKLTAIQKNGVRPDRTILWLCKCECGTECTVASRSLITGHTKTCGCSRKMDLVGQRFGKLAVIERVGTRNSNVDWKCQCDCGNTHNVVTKYLVGGYTQSCGCLQLEKARKHDPERGVWRTPEYRSFMGAKARCQNPNTRDYPEWGGRGIKFNFTSFQEFYAAVGPRPSKHYTLERVDNNGHYESGNVMWATWQQQANNRRNSLQALKTQMTQLRDENVRLRSLLKNVSSDKRDEVVVQS